MKHVYLAARYSRRIELCRYRDVLLAVGVKTTSRWLDGEHELLDREGLSVQAEEAERVRFASEDWADVMAADTVISFTEVPRSTNGRGGRHVEFGAALATGKRCIVIGPRENVFHCLPQVERYDSWDAFALHDFGGAYEEVA